MTRDEQATECLTLAAEWLLKDDSDLRGLVDDADTIIGVFVPYIQQLRDKINRMEADHFEAVIKKISPGSNKKEIRIELEPGDTWLTMKNVGSPRPGDIVTVSPPRVVAYRVSV